MRSNLAPDSPAVRIRLVTVADTAGRTSVLSACGGAKDAPVLRSWVTLPDSWVVLRAPRTTAPHGCRRCSPGAISGVQTSAMAQGSHGIACPLHPPEIGETTPQSSDRVIA